MGEISSSWLFHSTNVITLDTTKIFHFAKPRQFLKECQSNDNTTPHKRLFRMVSVSIEMPFLYLIYCKAFARNRTVLLFPTNNLQTLDWNYSILDCNVFASNWIVRLRIRNLIDHTYQRHLSERKIWALKNLNIKSCINNDGVYLWDTLNISIDRNKYIKRC